MRVVVTRNTFIGGKLVQASPEPIVVDDAVGKQLIGLGKAVLAPEVIAAVPAPEVIAAVPAPEVIAAVPAPVEPVAVETVTESAPVEPVLPASKKDKGKVAIQYQRAERLPAVLSAGFIGSWARRFPFGPRPRDTYEQCSDRRPSR